MPRWSHQPPTARPEPRSRRSQRQPRFARDAWPSDDLQRRAAAGSGPAPVPIAVGKNRGPSNWPPIGHPTGPKVASLQANCGYRYRDSNLVRAVDGPTATSAPPRKQNAPSRRIALRPGRLPGRRAAPSARGDRHGLRAVGLASLREPPCFPRSAKSPIETVDRAGLRAAGLRIRAEFLHSPGRTVRNASTRVSPTRRVPRPPNRPTGGGPGEAQPCSRRTRPMSSCPDGVACRRRSE